MNFQGTRQQMIPAAALILLLLVSAGCNKFKSREEVREGNTYFKVGKYDTALAKYNLAMQLDPDAKKILLNVGLAYMGLYQPGSKAPQDVEYSQKAIDSLRGYLQAYPDDSKAAEYLVTLYNLTGRTDDAIAFYKDFVTKHPNDPKAQESLANLYFQRPETFNDGLAAMQQAIALTPSKSDLKALYETIGAQAWDKAYHFPDLTSDQKAPIITAGITAINKALDIDPNYEQALAFINLLYREQAAIETDPNKKQQDTDMADQYRAKAMAIVQAQQAQARKNAPATGSSTSTPQ